MKYKIIKVDEDTSNLSYKDKSFNFKRDVQLLKDYEDIERKAKIKLFADLKSDGLTANDLIVEYTKNGKKYQDNSNLNYLEEDYILKSKLNFFDECCKKITNMSMNDLIQDIGLDDTDIEQFGFDFGKMIRGEEKEEFPSKEEKTD